MFLAAGLDRFERRHRVELEIAHSLMEFRPSNFAAMLLLPDRFTNGTPALPAEPTIDLLGRRAVHIGRG